MNPSAPNRTLRSKNMININRKGLEESSFGIENRVGVTKTVTVWDDNSSAKKIDAGHCEPVKFHSPELRRCGMGAWDVFARCCKDGMTI